MVETRTFRQLFGKPGGTSGVDDAFAERSLRGLFAGLDLRALGYEPTEHAAGSGALHVVLANQRQGRAQAHLESAD